METQNQQPKHWQSLEDLNPDARAALKKVIEEKLSPNFVSRREFIEWMGGVSAVLGSAACTRQPTEKIVPYVNAPEYMVPGRPLYFASVGTFAGQAQGVLVESHMGRPTKVDGLPEHPSSLGGSDIYAQASVLDLYDPDRLQSPHFRGVISSWSAFYRHFSEVRSELSASSGAGLRILSDGISSPTLAAQRKEVLAKYPQAKWITYDSVNLTHMHQGAVAAFGETLEPNYLIAAADVIVSFDCDFLSPGYSTVRYTKDFSKRRDVGKRNRVYVVESSPTLAGANADHRWSYRPSEVLRRLYALALALKIPGVTVPGIQPELAQWAASVAKDLVRAGEKSLLMVGPSLPPEAHAVGYAINGKLGSFGRTLNMIQPPVERQSFVQHDLASLTQEMAEGKVTALFILGGNPVYTAPGDTAFAESLAKVGFSASLSLWPNETANACQWMLPETHFMEQWSDARAHDGLASVVQPLIAPLYGGKSKHELASAILGRDSETPYDVVRAYWKAQRPKDFKSTDFESEWRSAVHDGYFPASSFAPQKAVVRPLVTQPLPAADPEGWDILFRPDPTIWDGSYGNNPWLQELPKPLTKTTWENLVFLSPASAARLNLTNGDVVEVTAGGKKISGPAWVWAGHSDGSLTLHLGYGRTAAGRVGSKMGFDVQPLRSLANGWLLSGAEVKKTGRRASVACTQDHARMEGRDIVRSAPIQEYIKNPGLFEGHHAAAAPEEAPQIPVKGSATFEDPDYAWGMAINLNACTGCNACVIACQSENNIATVGKAEVIKGRELHWLRIDRYYEGDAAEPSTLFQPVPCMHCETAPCEVVCPVGATSHSPEGINEMTYNRCVGTKYCSNNCPYKVRRFNFYHYADIDTPVLKLQRNPDVTIRARGVMEKCTYCVQRVNTARIDAKVGNRLIRDGEVKTACQSACPAEAIAFGNIKDQNSEVSRWKSHRLNYGLLAEELGTRPRTTYIAKLSNPNPELAAAGASKSGHSAPHSTGAHEGSHGS